MYGLIRSCFVWMSNSGPPRSLAFLLTISALLVNCGEPAVRWDVSAASGHRWWIDRFRASLKLFALVRLDHFRGFEAFWEVPATASTAQAGKWVKGPGAEFFRMLKTELKKLPFVAENLE
jgi:4-alpha-glucanotransferase